MHMHVYIYRYILVRTWYTGIYHINMHVTTGMIHTAMIRSHRKSYANKFYLRTIRALIILKYIIYYFM